MTVIIFILVLGLLVFVHELGHFVAARRAGAKVEEFGIGFPPRVFSWKRGETLYSLNIIPLGGFVKIKGEDEAEVKEKGSFGTLPIWRRAVVLAAGVFMNVVLAWVLFSIVALAGQPTLLPDGPTPANARDPKIQVLQVLPKSPAENAGIKAGDTIVSVTNTESLGVEEVAGFQEFITRHRGHEITVELKRGQETLTTNVTPRVDPPAGEGALGIALGKTGIVRTVWWQAPWEGLKTTFGFGAVIVLFVGELFASLFRAGGSDIVQNLAGPIGIANLSGEAARLGIVYLLQFTAVLSVNLAILNILPFPALDGGRLVFLAVEKLRGSPVKKTFEHATNMVGFMLLILLMIWVTWQDIVRFVL